MPVNDEYAARTACRDHECINTRELRGSLRGSFYSGCEGRRLYGGCKFSHTIFNTRRVERLGGDGDFLVKLDYGYGFERYGMYEGWDSGWDVTVNGAQFRSGGSMEKTKNLPKSLLLAEKRMGAKTPGSPNVRYQKVQSLCLAHHEGLRCTRPDCRYDHALVDSRRIEQLARWAPWGTAEYDMLTVECKRAAGRVRWKITMKPDAFAKLGARDQVGRNIPPRPFSHEDEDLLKVIMHMERIVGIRAVET